jgi:hypothetical protein
MNQNLWSGRLGVDKDTSFNHNSQNHNPKGEPK